MPILSETRKHLKIGCGHSPARRLLKTLLCLGLAGLGMAQAQERILDQKLIVSGASGQLGGLVVDYLLEDWSIPPENLILVSRTPESLDRYAAMGASVRFGDFTQPDSLDAAYAGGQRMLLISIGGGGDRPTLHKNAIDAAVAAGVEHIAYTSYVNADRNQSSALAGDHLRTEALILRSGVTWTMLRNQIYANGIVNDALRAIESGQIVTHLPDARLAYVTREDCAAAAAAVLATTGHDDKAYNITGPGLVGPREIAALAQEIGGSPVELIALSEDELAARLRASGMADAAIQRQIGFAAELDSPLLREISPAVADLTGHVPMSVRELLENNRDVLAAAGNAARR